MGIGLRALALGACTLFGVVNRPATRQHILLAGVAALFFACIDLAGPRIAEGLEIQTQTKQDSASVTTTLNGQAQDSVSWVGVKFGGTVWSMDPSGIAALTSPDLMSFELVQRNLNDVPIAKSTLSDTHFTVGMWNDWISWTSRQAVSNYIQPGTDLGYLVRPGFGLDDVATSQRIDAGIWKTDSMRLSLFAEYNRVGVYFEAPQPTFKPQDPFSMPNSTTTRFGGSVEWKPISFTLEQRVQQSLTQENGPIKTENQIGVVFSFEDLRIRSGIPQSMSWLLPSWSYLTIGQGRITAPQLDGVNGDTTSDVSTGVGWSVGKFYANVDYWWSDYRSQLYPWQGSGLDGSVGFHEDQWGIDLYLDAYRSSYADTEQLTYVLGGPQSIAWKYNNMSGGFRFSGHF
jgi:hypothetical protein